MKTLPQQCACPLTPRSPHAGTRECPSPVRRPVHPLGRHQREEQVSGGQGAVPANPGYRTLVTTFAKLRAASDLISSPPRAVAAVGADNPDKQEIHPALLVHHSFGDADRHRRGAGGLRPRAGEGQGRCRGWAGVAARRAPRRRRQSGEQISRRRQRRRVGQSDSSRLSKSAKCSSVETGASE